MTRNEIIDRLNGLLLEAQVSADNDFIFLDNDDCQDSYILGYITVAIEELLKELK